MPISVPSSVRGALRSVVREIRVAEQWLYARSVLPSDALTLPDFVGIGAQKAGTTWLHVNLQHHPDVYVPPERQDLHYFNLYQHRGVRYYASQFADGAGHVKGENTPAYGVMPLPQVRRVHDLLPDARILFVMRDPVERAWSHARMTLTRDTERDLEAIPDAAFFEHFRWSNSRERSDYLTILDRWTRVYPESQVFVGFFDDIVNRPRHFLTQVFDHIGVTRDVDWDGFPYNRVVNRGPKAPIPDRFREVLVDLYAEQTKTLQQRFGGPTLDWHTA